MRAFLDAILAFIGAESLTDAEFAGIELDPVAYDVASYNALLGVLTSRESVSSETERLRFYYLGRGVEVAAPQTGKSNILVGAAL